MIRIFLVANAYCLITVLSMAQSHFVIEGVNIIDVQSGEILENRDLVVEGEKITAISPGGSMEIAEDIEKIDGSQKYLIPGLAEMHAHIPTPRDGDDTYVRETLFLYLANGITTIRGMLGHPYHLALKTYLETNPFPSPRVYTSSPSMNGNTVTSPEVAEERVTQFAGDGYDFLKIHPGILRDHFDKMVTTAREKNILFSGHVPADVGIEHAIESGYASIDHLDGYIEGLAPEEIREDGGFFGVLLADRCDENKIEPLVRATKGKGVAVVPTQTLFTRWLSPKDPSLMVQEPEMAYIPPSLRFNWRQSKTQMLERLNYSTGTYNRFIELRNAFLRSFDKNGILMLLGSDAPQVFNVPGFSIHHEMKAMADAGISNLNILRSGTINVAQFFKVEDRGSLEVGNVADMVLLNANPLDDISNCSSIESVIYKGNILSKDKITEVLMQLTEKYRGTE